MKIDYDPTKAVNACSPLVRRFEGCSLNAYPDPATGDSPWAIGWGSTFYPDGRPVSRGDFLSQPMADAMLVGQLYYTGWLLAFRIPYWDQMTPLMQGALISFAYNVGPCFFGSNGFGSITQALRGKNWKAVPGCLALYINAGSPAEPGLRQRRAAEGDMWALGVTAANRR